MRFLKGKMGCDHVNKDDRLCWTFLDSSVMYQVAVGCNGLYQQGGQGIPGCLGGPDDKGDLRGLVGLVGMVQSGPGGQGGQDDQPRRYTFRKYI